MFESSSPSNHQAAPWEACGLYTRAARTVSSAPLLLRFASFGLTLQNAKPQVVFQWLQYLYRYPSETMAALACTSFAPEPTTKGITATANFGFKDRLLFAAELANDNLWLFIVVNIEYCSSYSSYAITEYRNLLSTHRHYTSLRWLRFLFFL